MIVPDYLEKAAEIVAEKMSHDELKERFVWHETQDRQMAFSNGEPDQVFELLQQAGINHEFDDPTIAELHIKWLEENAE